MKYIYYISILLTIVLAGCSGAAEPEQGRANTETFEPEAHPDDGVRTLRLYFEDHDLEYLYERDPQSDVRVDAHAKLDDGQEILPLEGVRFRGNSTRRREKKPFNIEFVENQEFLDGSNRLNLNAMYTDPSMMREQLAFDMFRSAGIPAPRTEYYRLYINDNYEGLYTSVERIDEDFLEANGLNPEGTLVRDQMRSYKEEINTTVNSTFAFNLDHHADNKAQAMEKVYDYRGTPNWLKLGELQDWVYSTPAGDQFEAELFDFVEEDNFMDFLAVHYIIGDVDAFGDDYWMYLNHADPDARWQFIPWDKDLVMGSDSRGAVGGIRNDFFSYENPMVVTWQNILVQKTLESENLRADLEERMAGLMENEFSDESMQEQIASYQLIVDGEMATELSAGAFTLHGQNFFGDVTEYDYRKQQVPEYFNLRREFLPHHFDHPLKSDDYAAEKADITENENITLTNEDGFVMAHIETESVSGNPRVRISIEENSEVEGINQTYSFETEDGSVTGEVTLYFRNDTGWLSRGNWLQIGSDFDALHTLEVKKEGAPVETAVNPYTSKVVFNDTLEGSSSYTIEFTE